MNEVLPQLNELMFSSVEGVLVESVEVIDTVVRVEARTTAGRAVIPGCGCWCWSGRIHDSYLRSPRDLPTAGKIVVVSLRVPRFVCEEESCGAHDLRRASTRPHPQVRAMDRAAAVDAGVGRS
ncbi:transposase family protein [Streptomyces sp. NBC_00564]|uniref:transposase family protein n=1 Tax=Streptomyces sp. NBC_00564 TaxID=2903663 RepID=UPI00352D8186|nr:transposase family protein [Streptomyces sp. NBC_00564]